MCVKGSPARAIIGKFQARHADDFAAAGENAPAVRAGLTGSNCWASQALISDQGPDGDAAQVEESRLPG